MMDNRTLGLSDFQTFGRFGQSDFQTKVVKELGICVFVVGRAVHSGARGPGISWVEVECECEK